MIEIVSKMGTQKIQIIKNSAGVTIRTKGMKQGFGSSISIFDECIDEVIIELTKIQKEHEKTVS